MSAPTCCAASYAVPLPLCCAAAAEDPALAAARSRALSAVGRLVRGAALVRERPGDPAALRSLVEVTEGEAEVLGLLPEVSLSWCTLVHVCVGWWVEQGLADVGWVGTHTYSGVCSEEMHCCLKRSVRYRKAWVHNAAPAHPCPAATCALQLLRAAAAPALQAAALSALRGAFGSYRDAVEQQQRRCSEQASYCQQQLAQVG